MMDETQMTNLSMTGKPVFPMTMRKLMRSSGKTAVLKEFMLSGVKVKPRSIKADEAVKKPHQVLACPALSTMVPYPLLIIHGTRHTTPRSQNPQK